MRDRYDFSEGKRGSYQDRLDKEAKLVVLDPDVAAAFPTSEKANDALRRLIRESGDSPAADTR